MFAVFLGACENPELTKYKADINKKMDESIAKINNTPLSSTTTQEKKDKAKAAIEDLRKIGLKACEQQHS